MVDSTKSRPASRRRPDLDTLYCVNPDGSRNAIHPADVRGRFQNRKKILWALLIGIYMLMPWVKMGGQPAILIDITSRSFYLFGNTFNAQDFYLAFFWVTGIGFTLIVVSALFGRIWCGYGCPQTVFLEGVFRRIERWIEGSAPQREKLAKAPLGPGKILRVGSVHLIYIAISLALSHTFLSYFMPVEDVFLAVTSPPTEHFTAFLFVMVFTAIIYFNFAWFREQLCIVICPYGRLQGALYDPDTVVVGYDARRGEPRGKYHEEGRGHCIDCYRCVAVCPTGIDIRNGTQLECVGCANCIDACDEVMDKLDQERGLVRYDSQRGFEGGKRRFMRFRVAIYAILLAIGLTVFTVSASGRTPFEANIIRLRGAAFVLEQETDTIRNSFRLHLVNKLPETHTFTIAPVEQPYVEFILPTREIELESLQDFSSALMVRIPRDKYWEGMSFQLTVTTEGHERIVEAPFVGPIRR